MRTLSKEDLLYKELYEKLSTLNKKTVE